MARKAPTPRKRITEQREDPLATSNLRAELSPDELRRRIAERAYYRAEQRGFAPGYEEKDWIEAEAEVMRSIGREP